MYKLAYNNSKKGKQLILLRNNKYLTSVTYKGVSKKFLLTKLKLKVDLILDWEQLYHDLIYAKCGWCGETFKKTKKRVKYCSDDCSHNAMLEKNRESRRKRQRELKEHKRRIIHENITNKGYLPSGFQEFDTLKTMGSSNLTGHIADDMDKEERIVKKELRRFNLL